MSEAASEGRASARPKLQTGKSHLESTVLAKMGTCGSTSLRDVGRRHPIHLSPLEAHNRSIIVFVTACTKNRRKVLTTPEAHDAIVQSWKAARFWLVGRYVVMPDHLHFFCSRNGKDAPSLEQWMRFWKSQVTRALHESAGGLWQPHHWDRQLRRGESYDQKWDYVCNNPVRHKLVEQALAWPYQGELNELRW